MDREEKEILKIIKDLEGLASEVLKLKHESIPRRPIVIEFCGSPKSGKSSCINSLSLFLRRNRFRTKVLTERASVCPVNDKYDPNFNIWTACSAIAELVEALSNSSKDYDVIILDRGIFDALCWFNWLKDNNSLDEENFKSLEFFLVMNKWRTVIDLIYVFTATPEVSLQREYASLLTRKLGSIMCDDALSSYKACVENVSKKYADVFQGIEIYDTSQRSLNDVNHDITKSILEIIQSNIAEKVGYFPRASISSELPETFSFSKARLNNIVLDYQVRAKVEEDDGAVQPIPILVITNKERNKVLVVKKSKTTTSKESPESDRLLLYLGGHTREEDSFGASDTSLLSISKLSLRREIKEETGLNYIPSSDDLDPLCIWMRDNDRSKKHLAICYIMEVNFSRTKVRLDKNEFMTGGNTKSGMILDIDEILNHENELESWSKLILRDCFGKSFGKPATLI
jgi:predicted NUDIX family phosphoesterase